MFSEIREAITGWVDDFWAALNHADRDLASAKHQALVLLDTIAAFEKVESFRPWRTLYRSYDEMLTAMRGVYDFTLTAYAAETPIVAQDAERAMQAQIDIAAAAISRWGDALNQLGELIGASPEDQLIIAASYGFHESSDSGAFVGNMLDNLGLQSRPFPGVTEVLTTCVELCTMLGERQAFADTASAMLGLLRTQGDKASQVIDRPLFRENFGRALSETYRSGTILHVLAVLSGNEQLAVDALVDAAHSLVESGTRHSLALAASVLGETGYKRWLEKGANECIRYVLDQGYPNLVSDLSLDLRNAMSHKAYRLTADGGLDILNDRGNLRCHLDAGHLVDAVVAGHVLFMGLTIGVVLFVCEAGLDVLQLLADADHLPYVHAAQYTALMSRWPLPEVELSSDRADTVRIAPCPPIEVSSNIEQLKVLVTAITIARHLPSEVSFVQFYDREDPLLLDVRRTNETFDNEDPAEASSLFLRFVHSLRRGDSRAISDEEWRKLLMTHAVQAAEGRDGNAIRRLRKLRSVVQDCGDSEFAEELATLIASILNRLTTLPQPVERLDLLSLPASRPPSWISPCPTGS